MEAKAFQMSRPETYSPMDQVISLPVRSLEITRGGKRNPTRLADSPTRTCQGNSPKHKTRPGLCGLKLLVGFSEVAHGGGADVIIHGWQRPQNTGVVPVTVVFGQIAKSFVWVEENVLMPTVGNTFNVNGSALKADCLVCLFLESSRAYLAESAADLPLQRPSRTSAESSAVDPARPEWSGNDRKPPSPLG